VPTDAYLRYPHLHGDLLTFVADDDVWIAPIQGGRAWRLTADRVPVSFPRFSPDGRWVAWGSRRDGDPEVYLAAADGGAGRRLTYWGNGWTRVCGWTPDGDVLAVTSAGQAFGRHGWAHAVPVDGAPPRRLDHGAVDELAMSGERTLLLTAVNGEPARWKRYRGGGTGQLWVTSGDEPATRILPESAGHLESPMLVDDRIAVLSDHDGVANIYACLPDGTDLTALSHHDDFYARHASTDGRRIVYERAGELWLLDGPETERLDIRLGGAGAARRPHVVTAGDHLDDLSCDHKGRASAVEVRGTVHWMTHRDGPARVLSDDPTARARLPRVLGRTGKVAWITDAGGAEALEVGAVTGGEVRRLAAGRVGVPEEMTAAPDGGSVAIAAHDGRLLLVDTASGDTHELAASDDGPVGGVAYAPDSAWLAWSQPGPGPLRRIRLARLADRTVVDVTDARFVDTEPVFTLDGKHLAFLSRRGFDPVYDAHVFDLSFPLGCRPYLVPLAATTPSPFAPSLDGRAIGKPDEKDEKTEKADKTDTVAIDLEGLSGRVVAVPVEESRYFGLDAVKGGLTWLKRPLAGAPGDGGRRPHTLSLHRFDLGERKGAELVESLDWYAVSGDGEQLLVSEHGALRVVPSAAAVSDDDAEIKVDLSRPRITVDPVAQWRHAFDEAGRIMRQDFWTEDMGGVDWDGVLARYRPLVERVAGADDFADLLWEVFGELGTSHAYVMHGAHRDASHRIGHLGADLARDDDGRWRVVRVLTGESSDPRARAPLTAPGVVVRPGDAIIAVDGRPVDPVTGPGPLLIGTADRPVELTLEPAGGGEPRRMAVVPLADDDSLRYQNWVADRRRHVRELSGDRLGYLHIPDMMGGGWAQFHRDLRVEMAHDGLVVDLRGNGGGHVSQLVVEKLARKVIGWDVPRGLVPTPYPDDAPRGPIVAIIDQDAGSDGDIVAAAIRALDLGPLVGTRTWGGVIGISGGHELLDGTTITVPRYATWFDGLGWGLENHGVDPDVEVVVTPEDWVAGRDPQLDTGVSIALERLASHPPARPPGAG
jgi:tricorn protease